MKSNLNTYLLLTILLPTIGWSAGLEIPAYTDTAAVVSHHGFALEYAEPYEQARWVAYFLTPDRANGTLARSGKFKSDPLVATGSAKPSDYTKSGYDRGHLAPAADMEWSEQSMNDCFFMSNMSPQAPSFNRGIWKTLEAQVRTWAKQNDTEYIATGPILRDGLPTIGTDRVAVPEYYYKAIIVTLNGKKRGIGFILKNEGSQQSLQSFAVTIDSLKKITGIAFFPALPESLKNAIESHLDLTKWSFDNSEIKPRHHRSHSKTSLFGEK